MTEPRNLDASTPADAAEIVAVLVGRLRMDGLTGGEVGALFQAVETIKNAVAPPVTGDDHG
jgi:hypothetical protein